MPSIKVLLPDAKKQLYKNPYISVFELNYEGYIQCFDAIKIHYYLLTQLRPRFTVINYKTSNQELTVLL